MPNFVNLQEQKPHSTDLNPLHHSVWDILQELVCEGRCGPFVNSKILMKHANVQDVFCVTWYYYNY